MPEGERVNIYIDGSNLYHTLRETVGRTNVNLGKFASKLAGERKLVRTYYYTARVDQTKDPQAYKNQQKFLEALQRIDYFEAYLGRLIYHPNWPTVPPHEKGIDIKIATDMLVHGFRGNYDTAVLVSEDTDFADAVQAVKDLGRHVEVALTKAKGSQKLREVADRTVVMNSDFLSDCWMA